MLSMKLFLISSLIKYTLFQIDKENSINIIKIANDYGFDLTNPEDDFFHDICLHFRYIKKDITLNYRRNYYFFPKNEDPFNKKLIFQIPKRNNTNECFNSNNSFSSLFTNIVFLFFFPMFIIQFILLMIILFLKFDESVHNTPMKKLKMEKSKKSKKNKKIDDSNSRNKTSYSEFIPEVNPNQAYSGLEMIKEDDIITNKNIHMDISNQKFNNQDTDINILKQNSSEPILKKNENGNDINSEPSPTVEKSTENYTFGVNFGQGFKFSSSSSIKDDKKKDNGVEKQEDKIKRIEYVYNKMNPKLNKIINNKNNINMNADSPITIGIQKQNEKFYVREEYFYFGYLLSRMEDRRTIFQIYFDLLEQCQIFFKFLYSPFNIYEDRKLQIIYYLLKINLYFLINCLFITSSVINDIYDGKNYFINDLKRSVLATIITYGISSILYYLTNVKRLLIKRRYKLINLKIKEQLINREITNFTLGACVSFLFNKLLLLFFAFIFLFAYSSYVCFSFCNVYYYTQFILLKCVLLSITLSQITPICMCWLPAYLRKRAIQKKKAKLYDLNKILELLYITW